MRTRITRRLLALIIAVVLLGSFLTALADERPLPESGPSAPSQFSAQKDAAEASDTRQGSIAESASDLIEAVAFELPEGFVADEAIASSSRALSNGNYTPEEGYALSVATMLTIPAGVVGFDGVADDAVVEAMVWLQELPAVLERIYSGGKLFTAAYGDASTNAANARESIRVMGASRTRTAAPAINIQFEYSEIFAGFAITAPLSELQKIADMDGVFAVAEMAYYDLDNEYIPDPTYSTPGNLESREYARIGELHAEGIDGTGVKVGVIDSGIQVGHPDLVNAYKGGYNFLQRNTDMSNPDEGHGTHVSGTIASGGITSLGVAPAADLYMGQVFGATGPGGSAGSDAVVTAAMEAFSGGGTLNTGLPKVDVVNMSLGIRDPGANSAYVSGCYARNNMVLAGVTVANSAGNSATERNVAQRQNYSTTSSNASLTIAVASSQFGSQANMIYSQNGFELTPGNSDALLSGMFRNDGFGNTQPITFTLNVGNAGSYLADLALLGTPLNYYGTYTIQPIEFVEGKGYEIVWINAGSADPLADSTEQLAMDWRNANAANSMVGKILAFNRGIGFGVMYGESLRTGAAGVIMLDRDPYSSVNMTIRNVPSAHGVVFQTGVAMRQALLGLKDADGHFFFNPSIEGRRFDHAPKEPSGFSAIGPVMENAHIKPDIIAPGDSILSTVLFNEGSYASMGGTSMSSPFVAGCAALLIQHLRATGQDASPATVKARLMNTADPDLIGPNTNLNAGHPSYYYNNDGTEISVYEQGSGFVDVYRAIKENVYITVETSVPTGFSDRGEMIAKMASFNFGEIKKGESATLTATVNGLADYELEVVYNHDTRYSNKNLNKDVSVAVAKNGNTFNATVTIGEDANADRLNGGNLYEGYIIVKGNGKSYVLPWATRIPHQTTIPPEPQGTADKAKITLIADASLNMYTPVIGVSMWFDSSNQLYDMFMTPEGVTFGWMNTNCKRVPAGALMGGSVNSHLLIGQTSSIILDPDTYDILSVAMQNTDTFIGSGDFRALKEYEFEKGYEYVIIVEGSGGGNPAFSLQARKTYNGDLAEGWAKVTLNVPTDVWDDGTGYVLYLDMDAQMVDAYYAAGGGTGSWPTGWPAAIGNYADYRIPPNATLVATTPIVAPYQSMSVVVPAGFGDYIILNPYIPMNAMYVPGNGVPIGNDQPFEANKHYTFTAVSFDDGWDDGILLTVVDEQVDPPEPPEPEPGTSPNAKVTFNHGAWAAPYDLTASIWFDASNYMYDNFNIPGNPPSVTIDPDWMNANCLRIPQSAMMVVRNSMLPAGQSGSIILEPDTYDILPVWSQLQQGIDRFGVYTGDMRFEKEYPIEAGWEYIFTTSLTGGAPYLTIEKVPYDKVPDYDGISRITLNVPIDVWEDGSGYMMFLDSDAKMVADLIAAGGLSGNWPTGWPEAINGYADYRIPANANTTVYSPSVLPGNSVTIDIESGIYDYLTINPDGYGFYVPMGGVRYGVSYAFEANMHYTFTAVWMGGGDGITVSVIPFDPVDTVLEEITVDITAPVARALPQASVSGTGFNGAITWAPADAPFKWETIYTANVALSATPGFFFSDTMTVAVPGATSVSVTVIDEKHATVSAVFPATAPNPGMAHIMVIDATGNDNLNLLLLDSTQQAIAKRLSGLSLSVFTDFDDTVPAVAQWGALSTDDLFKDDGEGEIVAGTYDTFWAFWTDTAGWKTAFATKFTFEANKTYLVVVSEHGEGWDLGSGVYTIVELTDETRLDSFKVNKNSMNMLGGQWKATAQGIFHEDVAFEVYLDGALLESGVMAGNIAVKTATVAIPRNETGIDRLYEIKLPAFNVSETLVVSGAELGIAQVTYTVGDPWGDGSGYMLLFDSTNTASTANFALYDYHIPSDAATGHDLWNDSETIDIIEGTYAYMESNWWMGSFFSPIYAKNFEIQAGYHYFFTRWTSGSTNLLISWLTCCENPDNEHVVYSEELSYPATCTEDGADVYVCKFCGEICYESIIPALGHDYVAVVTPPTCTEQGFTTYTCSKCGDSYTDDYEPALGHKDGAPTARSSSMNLQNNTTVTITVESKCERCGKVTVLASASVKLKQSGTQTVKVGTYDVTVVVNQNNMITSIYVGKPPAGGGGGGGQGGNAQ